MFFFAESFDKNIGKWDVKNVTDMECMFYYAKTLVNLLLPLGINNTPSLCNYSVFSPLDLHKYVLDNWTFKPGKARISARIRKQQEKLKVGYQIPVLGDVIEYTWNEKGQLRSYVGTITKRWGKQMRFDVDFSEDYPPDEKWNAEADLVLNKTTYSTREAKDTFRFITKKTPGTKSKTKSKTKKKSRAKDKVRAQSKRARAERNKKRNEKAKGKKKQRKRKEPARDMEMDFDMEATLPIKQKKVSKYEKAKRKLYKTRFQEKRTVRESTEAQRMDNQLIWEV